MNGPLNILVAEKDKVLREERLMLIDRCGHLGHPVASLADARDRRGRLSPEVMLFSGEIWAEGGADLIAHFAEKGKVCRVLVCGDEEVQAARAEIIDQGAQAVLLLPLSTGELCGSLEALMAGPPAGVELPRAAAEPEPEAESEEEAAVGSDEIEASGEVEESDEVREHILELAARLADGAADISNISPVAVELQSLSLGSEAPGVAAMIEKVERDPNIAAAVLRAANSVAYRGMPRVLDLSAAGRRLGSRRLGEVAQMAALKGAFEAPPKSGWSELLSRMWHNTVVTAHTCRLLAAELGFVHPGQAYSMALLHNLGEVLVVDLYKQRGETPPVQGKASGPLRTHMEQHHTALGEVLIRSWGLPGSLATLSRVHHDPSSLPPGTPLARSAWLLAAAYGAVVASGTDYKDEHSEGPPLEVASAALGIPMERVLDTARRAEAWWLGQEAEAAPPAPPAPPPAPEPASPEPANAEADQAASEVGEPASEDVEQAAEA